MMSSRKFPSAMAAKMEGGDRDRGGELRLFSLVESISVLALTAATRNQVKNECYVLSSLATTGSGTESEGQLLVFH